MECPVCLDLFTSPLMLPGCGHTICQSCAELMLTDVNYLRCPECRLVYQLRQGIRSLPKNVALQRAIDEYRQKTGGSKCDQHPEDKATLYCKTCEKSICVKCFFGKQADSAHSDHEVNTSEDALSRELRILRETRQQCEDNLQTEREYVQMLERTQDELKTLMDEKLDQIEKNKNALISQVKQTAAKLKFTLKGSIARDSEFLTMALESANERMQQLEDAVSDADCLCGTVDPGINTLKDTKSKFDKLDYCNTLQRPSVDSFKKVASFDTDLKTCLHDPQKALSYQTEVPRKPEILADDCSISDTIAFVRVKYDETVRAKNISIHYKESMYKGMSEKVWKEVAMDDKGDGIAEVLLRDLCVGTMYRLYAVARNDFGSSEHSAEMWCRTASAEIEKRVT